MNVPSVARATHGAAVRHVQYVMEGMDVPTSQRPSRSAPRGGDRGRSVGPLRFAVLATAAFALAGASLVTGLADANVPVVSEPPKRTHRVALSVPREAASGADLLYAVTVVSAGGRPECLAYEASLVGPDGGAAAASGPLTCARPTALAVPDTFALRLALPVDLPPGEYQLVWRLAGGPDAVTRYVRVRAGG